MSLVENQAYKVKTHNFEGPFPMLLELIEKRKLHINDVSLASITDDYLKNIQTINADTISDVSEFIQVASTLILIKSRSILPGFALTDEEEQDADELKRRLELYAIISDISVEISKQYGKKILIMASGIPYKQEVAFRPGENLNADLLYNLSENILRTVPKKEAKPEVRIEKTITIEEMFDKLMDRIEKAVQLSFFDVSGKSVGTKTKAEKVTVIVSFLAMLELVRNGIISAEQGESYGDISMSKQEKELNEELDEELELEDKLEEELDEELEDVEEKLENE